MEAELNMIKYLVNEIEEDAAYRIAFEKIKAKSQKEAEAYNNQKRPSEYTKYYWQFLPEQERKPLAINDNLKMIRRLCLKLYR